ncbi:RNA polymerase sigma-70 factor [Prevotella aurantiaca]|uniref:RNA polymerase sigma-70 factor n=1 Tax=Prevotella aurantiaca TaxID=596085 RepID=UPI0028DCAB1F|nr:RNA polymerase sigma-70 factor [Prevotella aurantiaca]
MSENRKEQFRLRFKKYYPMLCKIANGYIADRDDCEDIVQTLFISVWDKQKDCLPEEEMLAYMKVAIRNNCLTFLNNNKTYEKISHDDNTLKLAAEDSESNPTTDYKQLLEKVLEEMSPKCREVFTMSKLQKMKYKEIAAHLDISEKTVENHIGKAIKIIRAYIAANPIVTIVILLISIALNL